MATMAKKAAKAAVAKQIDVENVGPIDQFHFTLADYGVTVLSAANGSGKSILLNAVAALAKGAGKVPLKDDAERGSIEGFGARISISGQCRHQGGFDVEHLEGRFDLSELVDPGIADPEKADKRRVKAMIALTGAQADAKLFEKHPAFQGFPGVVNINSKDDLLVIAEDVRKQMQEKARFEEQQAQELTGEASGIRQAVGDVEIDEDYTCPACGGSGEVTEEHEAYARETLLCHACRGTGSKTKAAHEYAVQELTALKERQKMHSHQAGTVEQLKAALADLQQAPTEWPATKINVLMKEANLRADFLRNKQRELQQQVEDTERQLSEVNAEYNRHEQMWHQANEHETKLRSLEEKLAKATAELDQTVGADEVKQAEQAVEAALQSVLAAEKAEQAKEQLQEAAEREKQAKAASDRAKQLRAAAAAVDEVLSSAIKCPSLRVEQVDDVPRLVTDHPQRGVTPYAELSEGERWRIAIDLGADQVGEAGLLVIPQHAWEGIDAFVRPQIHAHAKARKVYILTAEATRDEEQGKQMVAAPFEGATS
jgi:hypothetical protein